MKKLLALTLCFVGALCVLAACSGNDGEVPADTDGFQIIDAQTAKQMMNEHPNAVILDVRSEEEFREGHIPGALLIPDTNLAQRAEEELPDKDAVILIYCRSGNRSITASHILVDMGYSRVYEFGGIQDWPFEIVTP